MMLYFVVHSHISMYILFFFFICALCYLDYSVIALATIITELE